MSCVVVTTAGAALESTGSALRDAPVTGAGVEPFDGRGSLPARVATNASAA